MLEPSQPKCGVRGTWQADLRFTDMLVPRDRVLGEVGRGLKVALSVLDYGRCTLSAGCVGGARRCLELAVARARTREQFGRPIGTFQAVSQRLADGYIDVQGARLTLWQAAWRLAGDLPSDLEVASAKLWAADAGHKIAHTTVHVHGGVGIDLDGAAHRYFTAAKRLELALGGSTEQARRYIRAGRVKVAVVIPPNFAHTRAAGQVGSVLALVDGSDQVTSDQAAAAIDGVAVQMDVETAMEPVYDAVE
jgi:alkylation response protein AidB-like acyl-CoA dehydrogenase